MTSLVKDFTHPDSGERIICGSSPLIETVPDNPSSDDDIVIAVTDSINNVLTNIVDSVSDLVERGKNRSSVASDPSS